MAEPARIAANAAAKAQEKADQLKDVPGQIDANFGMAVERLDTWVDGAIRLLPNIVVGFVVILVFIGISLVVRRLIERSSARRNRDNLGEVLGGFVKWVIILLGFLLAATIVIPSLKPGDLIAGLGVSSVAIGFAFKDILQNWLAGLLILFRQPFEIGDQIQVQSFEGTVRRIETRATLIETYDGQRVVIPNSDIYTNSIVVRTAFEKRRSEYDIGIGYGDDIDKACDVIRTTIAGVAGVEQDPGPEALPWELAASWVSIRARWWTHSRRADVVHVRASVVGAVKKALDDAGIDMPYETTVALLHDQTEADEGDRSKQREGWPAPKDGSTKPRWKVIEEERAKRRNAGDGAAGQADARDADQRDLADQRPSAPPSAG